MRKFSILSALLLMLSTLAGAQEPDMADAMRSNGKIYVVVLVLATIFAGIIIYLLTLDRKISKFEKNN